MHKINSLSCLTLSIFSSGKSSLIFSGPMRYWGVGCQCVRAIWYLISSTRTGLDAILMLPGWWKPTAYRAQQETAAHLLELTFLSCTDLSSQTFLWGPLFLSLRSNGFEWARRSIWVWWRGSLVALNPLLQVPLFNTVRHFPFLSFDIT